MRRVSLSPVVGTLLKASWDSSDSNSGPNSPSTSPPPAAADLGVGLELAHGEGQPHEETFRSDVQSLVAVITPRKVRFCIERLSPERMAMRGGSSSPSPPAQSAQPPVDTEHVPHPVRATGPGPSIPQLNVSSPQTASSSTPRNIVSTSSLLFPPPPPWPAPSTTSSPTVPSSTAPHNILPPSFPWFAPPSETTASRPLTLHDPSQANTTGWHSFQPSDTSLDQDDSMQRAPSPYIPALPSSPDREPDLRHMIPIDNTPRPLPHNVVPTFVAHRFRAGDQDGYTRSFKTSTSFPLSHPPLAGEWELGDVFLHEQSQSGDVQIWIWDTQWVLSHEYDPHPTLPDRYLCFRSKLEPSWVKGQTVRSYKSRHRQKEGQLLARGKTKAC